MLILLCCSDEKLRNKRHTYVFSATLTLLHSGPQRMMKKKKKIKLDEKQKLGTSLIPHAYLICGVNLLSREAGRPKENTPKKKYRKDNVAMKLRVFVARQANLCLRAFRHDKFKLRMPSHSKGPGIWLSV